MIERRFKTLQSKYKNHSSLMCFVKAIKGRNLAHSLIEKNFKLVDKDDYSGGGKLELMEWLYTI